MVRDGEYPYFAGFLIFVMTSGGGVFVKLGSWVMLKEVEIDPLEKNFYLELGSVSNQTVINCHDLGSATNQLVTATNHLDGVDLMVLSGVGGSCVLLWWCGIQAFLSQVYCTKNFLTFFLTLRIISCIFIKKMI